ncbi:MAG: amidohydrolase family protein [Ignavibacteriales bacterium]|nr:amidohydrolase family protein [Ignavibacteriales bacterium]
MRTSFLLSNARVFLDGRFESCSLRIVGSRVQEIGPSLCPNGNDILLPLEGACIVPGLINSHDHLELNLFSRLGDPPYSNYVEWGNDIRARHKEQIRHVMRVSLRLRLLWGAYKNILSGVTTVVHHNPYYLYFYFGFPIAVYRNYSWIHSLSFDPRLQKKLKSGGRKVRIIHLAEGVDSLARGELARLQELGGLQSNTVLVHGVGLSPDDCLQIERSGAGLVWCPGSNMFLFNRTAPIASMPASIPVALGTDSTLTGHTSLFDELREARRLTHRDADRLLGMVTSIPARMFGMASGKITEGATADLLVFDQESGEPFSDFLNLDAGKIKVLFKAGLPLLGEEGLKPLLTGHGRRAYERIAVGGRRKFIASPFGSMARRIKAILPSFNFNGLPLKLEEN